MRDKHARLLGVASHPSHCKRNGSLPLPRCGQRGYRQSGNALLYVLMAVGLLGALTYAYVQDSHDSYSAQSSVQIAESLYSQVNMIKAAVVEMRP